MGLFCCGDGASRLEHHTASLVRLAPSLMSTDLEVSPKWGFNEVATLSVTPMLSLPFRGFFNYNVCVQCFIVHCTILYIAQSHVSVRWSICKYDKYINSGLEGYLAGA